MRIDKLFFATICYADVFDYPQNLYEIWLWFIKKRVSIERVKKLVRKHSNIKVKTENTSEVFIHLPQRSATVKKRIKKRKSSRNKWMIVSHAVDYLRLIPSIQLVAVTGSLAFDNAGEEDDIDLLIISKENTIWTTRLLSIVTVELFSKRRKPGQKKFKNAICLNMFLTGNKLSLPRSERDLYSAHEALHMKPVFDRDRNYTKFLTSNNWIGEYLPNAYYKFSEENQASNIYKSIRKLSLYVNLTRFIYKPFVRIIYYILIIFEKSLKNLQVRYMQKRHTAEIISDYMLRFHPVDARGEIKRKFEKRLSYYKVPLDKVFYSHIK